MAFFEKWLVELVVEICRNQNQRLDGFSSTIFESVQIIQIISLLRMGKHTALKVPSNPFDNILNTPNFFWLFQHV
jgi:hypothetical protein